MLKIITITAAAVALIFTCIIICALFTPPYKIISKNNAINHFVQYSRTDVVRERPAILAAFLSYEEISRNIATCKMSNTCNDNACATSSMTNNNNNDLTDSNNCMWGDRQLVCSFSTYRVALSSRHQDLLQSNF